MANVTVTATTPNITVDSNNLTVTVAQTTSNVVVSQVATIANANLITGLLSVNDSGGDGSLTYDGVGTFEYTGPSASEVRAHFSNTSPITLSSGVIGVDAASLFTGKTTDDLPQGNSNVYFSTSGAAVNTDALPQGTSNIYFSTSGATVNTTNLPEGTNQYFTTGRANSAITTYLGDATNAPFSINGNLDIAGNLNYENVTDLYVTDQKITLNANAATDATVEIIANRPVAGSNTLLRWNETTDKWQFTNDGSTFYNIPASTSDLAEGTNLYYTNSRVLSAVSGNVTIGNLTVSGETVTQGNITMADNTHIVSAVDGGKITFGDSVANVNVGVDLRPSGATPNSHFAVGHAVDRATWTHPPALLVESNVNEFNSQGNVYIDVGGHATNTDGNFAVRSNATNVFSVIPSVGNNNIDVLFDGTGLSGGSFKIQGLSANINGLIFDTTPTSDTLLFKAANNTLRGSTLSYDATSDTFTYGSGANITINGNVLQQGSQLYNATGTTFRTAYIGAYGINNHSDRSNEPMIVFSAANVIQLQKETTSESNITTTANIQGAYVKGNGSELTGLTTTQVSEGTNLYYTTARSNTDFDARLATSSTSSLAEGTNLYFTTDRANTAIGNYSGALTNLTGNVTTTANISAASFIGDGSQLTNVPVETSQNIVRLCIAAETLAKGDAVFISGGTGDNPEVSKADADDAAKMPVFGIANEAISSSSTGNVVIYGEITSFNTTGFATGDSLFVSTTAGALQNTAPAGESSLIQKIGKVIKGGSAGGKITVTGAGRTNATPNLNNGNIFIGNGSNQSTTATLDTSIVPENTNLYHTTARANSAISNYTGSLQNLAGDIGRSNATANSAPSQVFIREYLYNNIFYAYDANVDMLINGPIGGNEARGVELYTKSLHNGSPITDGFEVKGITDVNGAAGTGNSAKRMKISPLGDIAFYLDGADENNANVTSNTFKIFGNTATTALSVNHAGNVDIEQRLNLNTAPLESDSNITTTANISGNYIKGNGSELTDIQVGNTLTDVNSISSEASNDLLLKGKSNTKINTFIDNNETEGVTFIPKGRALKSTRSYRGANAFYENTSGDNGKLSGMVILNTGNQADAGVYFTAGSNVVHIKSILSTKYLGGGGLSGNIEPTYANGMVLMRAGTGADEYQSFTYPLSDKAFTVALANSNPSNQNFGLGEANIIMSEPSPIDFVWQDSGTWTVDTGLFHALRNSDGDQITFGASLETNTALGQTGNIASFMPADKNAHIVSDSGNIENFSDYTLGSLANIAGITSANITVGTGFPTSSSFRSTKTTQLSTQLGSPTISNILLIGNNARYDDTMAGHIYYPSFGINAVWDGVTDLSADTGTALDPPITTGLRFKQFTDKTIQDSATSGNYQELSTGGARMLLASANSNVSTNESTHRPIQHQGIGVYGFFGTSEQTVSPRTRSLLPAGMFAVASETWTANTGTDMYFVSTPQGKMSLGPDNNEAHLFMASNNGETSVLGTNKVSFYQSANAYAGGNIVQGYNNIKGTTEWANISSTGITTTGTVKSKSFTGTPIALGNQSGDVSSSLNIANGDIYSLTATGGITINTIANAVAGSRFTVVITQDGTGSHALTSSMKFKGGDKTLSTAGGSIDVIDIFYDGTNYFAELTKAYA